MYGNIFNLDSTWKISLEPKRLSEDTAQRFFIFIYVVVFDFGKVWLINTPQTGGTGLTMLDPILVYQGGIDHVFYTHSKSKNIILNWTVSSYGTGES